MLKDLYFQLSADAELPLLDIPYLKQNVQLSQSDAPGQNSCNSTVMMY